jgi:hypothetical protein
MEIIRRRKRVVNKRDTAVGNIINSSDRSRALLYLQHKNYNDTIDNYTEQLELSLDLVGLPPLFFLLITTESQSWCQAPIWDPRPILISSRNLYFRQLRVCNFVAPSLTRGRVYNLLYNCYWASQDKTLLGQSPSELTAIFYCLI